jgi:hypothetical protein
MILSSVKACIETNTIGSNTTDEDIDGVDKLISTRVLTYIHEGPRILRLVVFAASTVIRRSALRRSASEIALRMNCPDLLINQSLA